MKKNALLMTSLLGLSALAVALCAGMVLAADTPTPPAIGAAAPDFTLPSESGANVSLHDFKGKWVVLYFYPKDFTTGCTIEAHGFQTDLTKYQAIKTEIVGVSVDSTDSHKDFCAKEGLNFKLLSDTKHEVVNLYGSVKDATPNSVALRNTFIVNPQGKIAKVFIAVQPTKHSAEVLEALNELQKAK